MTMTPDRYIARTPSDLIHLAPVVLGFEPEDSIVMMTFGGPRAFHARIDLPRALDDVRPMTEALVAPCVMHEVPRVVLLAFGRDDFNALGQLAESMIDADVAVVAAIEVQRDRFRTHLLGRDVTTDWLPIEGDQHRARAVTEGRVIRRSREELHEWVTGCDEYATEPALVADAVHADRDAWCLSLTKANVRQRLDSIVAAARQLHHLSNEVAPSVYAVLAYTAWQSGDGALAWVASDLAPDDSLARLVSAALQSATPPSIQ